MVEVLLPDMPTDALQRTAPTAMLEAARVGHEATVAALRAVGVTLKDPRARHLRVRGIVAQPRMPTAGMPRNGRFLCLRLRL